MKVSAVQRFLATRQGVLLFAAQAAVGLALFTHYGEAWDDASMIAYAENTLRAYREWIRTGTWPGVTYPTPVLEFYGVWPWVLAVLTHRWVLSFLHVMDVVHLFSWAFFMLGTQSLLSLLRRWFSEEAAWTATLLFATQPLLWGHGFINLKDTSTLSTMLLSLYMGLRFTDRLSEFVPVPDFPEDFGPRFWKRLPASRKKWAPGLFVVLVTSLLLAWGYNHLARPSSSDFWYSQILRIHRSFTLALGLVTFLVSALGWTWWLQSPPEGKGILRAQLREYARIIRHLLTSFRFWGAALALGLSVSVRVSGWWVWLLLLMLSWKSFRSRDLYAFFAWAVVALGVHYLTHPALFLQSPSRVLFFYGFSLRLASNFLWPGKVLFAGHFYLAEELPRGYVPWLHLIQTTEPTILLCTLGLLVLFRQPRLAEAKRVFVLWYGLPLTLVVLGTPPLYDNARQLLFLLPGLYIPVAAAWEAVRARVPGAGRFLLGIFALVPGLVALVRLHPYQYIYYNQLVGGVRGAFRRYEMDYWATSFREIARYLNREACASPARDDTLQAVTWEPVEPLADFLCPRFRAFSCHDQNRPRTTFYAVISTRYHADLVKFPALPDLYRVEREGAVLSVVRFVPRDTTPPEADGASCLPKDLPTPEAPAP